MYGIWSKNIDLALINKKMVAIFFCFVSEGSREVRVKAVLCKYDIQTSGNR